MLHLCCQICDIFLISLCFINLNVLFLSCGVDLRSHHKKMDIELNKLPRAHLITQIQLV